jgi:dolichyl-phosphate beta-glucosyltransferase
LTEVAVIVPCYNEADRLQYDAFIEFVREYRNITFIFVNDGSTDQTAQLLKELIEREQSHFALIELERNQGKAEAVRQGVLNAIAAGARYVGYWDADSATPLTAIPDFLEQLKRNSRLLLVIGARAKLLGRKIIRKKPTLSGSNFCDFSFHHFAITGLRYPVRSKVLRDK